MSETAMTIIALVLLHVFVLLLYSAYLQRELSRTYHLLVPEDGALGIPPTINFLGRDLFVEFMTNYKIVCNHSLGSSHKIMSEF